MIADNIRIVEFQIQKACSAIGRRCEQIRIVCVTKYADVSQIKEAAASGIKDIGESSVKDAREKFNTIGSVVQWHLVGHLQTNKVKHAVEFFDYIHSLDSIYLANKLQRYLEQKNRFIKAFVQVNVSGEKTKSGIKPEEAEDFIRQCIAFKNINIIGLMTIAPYAENPEDARKYFLTLRQIRDRIKKDVSENIHELSMGMTQDYGVAVEEGATFVRLGSAIFDRTTNR